MQVEERHYYQCVFVCVWVDVWLLSLASSPAPCETHSQRPNVDQKNIKRMILLRAALTLPKIKKGNGPKSLFFFFFLCQHRDKNSDSGSGTPGAVATYSVISYVMIFISVQFT